MRSLATIHRNRSLSPWLIVVLGLGLFALPIAHTLKGEPFLGIVLSVVPSALLSMALVAAGYWLSRSEFEPSHRRRIVAWTLVGFAVLGAAAALYPYYQRAHGGVVLDAGYIVASAATGGAAIGFLVGIYDAQRHRINEQHQETSRQLELLHRVLNHDVRNGVNVVLGHAEFLSDELDEPNPHLDAIEQGSRHVIELTQSSSVLRESVMGDDPIDLVPVNLTRVLEDVVSNARFVHDHASFEYDATDQVSVEANELLASVFENLVSNAVRHSDRDDPTVSVTVERSGDRVIVRVADDGPGVPDSRKERVFGRGEKGLDSPGTGLGLYLVDALVDAYGGSVWVEDNEPRGATFCVSLPAIDPSR